MRMRVPLHVPFARYYTFELSDPIDFIQDPPGPPRLKTGGVGSGGVHRLAHAMLSRIPRPQTHRPTALHVHPVRLLTV
jgi:hypothetical protein